MLRTLYVCGYHADATTRKERGPRRISVMPHKYFAKRSAYLTHLEPADIGELPLRTRPTVTLVAPEAGPIVAVETVSPYIVVTEIPHGGRPVSVPCHHGDAQELHPMWRRQCAGEWGATVVVRPFT